MAHFLSKKSSFVTHFRHDINIELLYTWVTWVTSGRWGWFWSTVLNDGGACSDHSGVNNNILVWLLLRGLWLECMKCREVCNLFDIVFTVSVYDYSANQNRAAVKPEGVWWEFNPKKSYCGTWWFCTKCCRTFPEPMLGVWEAPGSCPEGREVPEIVPAPPLFSSPAVFTMLTNARAQNGFYGDAVAFTGSSWYDVPAWMVKRSRFGLCLISGQLLQTSLLSWSKQIRQCFITHRTAVKISLI